MTDKAPSIDAEINALKDEFAFLGDWTERYQYIMDMGKQMPTFPPEKQDEAHKFHGCQSQVWFDYEWDGDQLKLIGTSDAMIVNGLIALLFRVYSDRSAEEILATDSGFIDDLGLSAHLSANRATGLSNMIEKIRGLAAERAA
ncbi:SufE family protein [Guyparkeria hydrothermalis]|uniref:SufE family protein n=1 Tax=Guyparkeria hydrothermalis TaxID=923 RepID=UPI00202186D7|nr:SufE family protein [Guyparkeria hydrothermalis]MCL7743878.1 SufE family protein [Guyparkeria hydrothermalis]